MMPEPGVSLQELHQQIGLLPFLRRALHLVEEIGPREAGEETLRIVQRQLLDDVAADAVGGRGRQGDGGRIAQQLAEVAQPGVVGAKIVPPLADAMGLVHRQELQPHRPDRLQKSRAAKPLRGHVHQAELAGRHLVEPGVLLGHRQRAVDERHRQPAGLELIDLVLHQGDQRRYDQRQPVQDHGRELVAEAFAAAGGHDAEAIASLQDGGDDFLLAVAEFGQAELRQVGFQVGGWVWHKCIPHRPCAEKRHTACAGYYSCGRAPIIGLRPECANRRGRGPISPGANCALSARRAVAR